VRDTSLDLPSMGTVNICSPPSFVLTRCCVSSRLTKILMRAILTVHTGRRFPTHALHQSSYLTDDTVRQWSANCGLLPNYGMFNTYYCGPCGM